MQPSVFLFASVAVTIVFVTSRTAWNRRERQGVSTKAFTLVLRGWGKIMVMVQRNQHGLKLETSSDHPCESLTQPSTLTSSLTMDLSHSSTLVLIFIQAMQPGPARMGPALWTLD